ncbi:TlpA family protein disulfide reductase [Paracoccus sp. (in: a-proteobacteria)]|uniref:TlpA family protein disulfide reductase n=1 Tax=Paracoccus sp. TaxID=267 RepID=UPI003A873DFD
MLRSALLYTALVIGANTAFAGQVDWQAAHDAGLVKLVPSQDAPPLPETGFADRDGGMHSFADYRGKVVLVNFWATWCAPCREEMPSLDALQTEMGGEDFQVVTIATGRNPPEKIDKFFDETGVKSLPVLLDPKQKLARSMGILGLPVSVLIDRDGVEVARLPGDADWSGEAAKQVIRQLMAD